MDNVPTNERQDIAAAAKSARGMMPSTGGITVRDMIRILLRYNLDKEVGLVVTKKMPKNDRIEKIDHVAGSYTIEFREAEKTLWIEGSYKA